VNDALIEEPATDRSGQYERFLSAFTADQFRILAYIGCLIPDRSDAHDVYQETALVLWKRFSTFDPDQEFLPWALGVARHQVLRHWRERSRDRHVFNETLLTDLADNALELTEELDARQAALRECLAQLTPRQRELVSRFYGNGWSAQQVADQWKRSVHAVYKTLKVLRQSLQKCVEQKLVEQQT